MVGVGECVQSWMKRFFASWTGIVSAEPLTTMACRRGGSKDDGLEDQQYTSDEIRR